MFVKLVTLKAGAVFFNADYNEQPNLEKKLTHIHRFWEKCKTA